nr:zinc metallopeptidase [Spirochaetota bacterium]
AVVFFQIITLPVEFNASTRAKELVRRYSIVGPNEIGGVEKVLSAAAMTYVAAAASAIVTLLYYLIRLGLLSGRDD